MTALALLTNRYVLAGLLVAALLAFGGVQTARLHHEKAAHARDRAVAAVVWLRSLNDQVALRVNTGTLQAALNAQSDAVREQAAQSDRALSELARTLTEARRAERATARRLESLSRPPVGATPLDRCNDAARRAREALR